MAVAPLFIATTADLLKALRLTGVKSGSDAEDRILRETLAVRLGFYERLGADLIDEIKATTYDDAPESAEELRRALANDVEARWVRLKLSEAGGLAVLFMDGSGGTLEEWNHEAAFRQGRPSRTDLEAMRQQVEEGILALLGREPSQTWKFVTVQPPCPPPPVGSSIQRGQDV